MVVLSFDSRFFDILSTGAFSLELLYPILKLNKLLILFQGSFFLSWKVTRKAFFAKFAKALKVLDVVMLRRFI